MVASLPPNFLTFFLLIFSYLFLRINLLHFQARRHKRQLNILFSLLVLFCVLVFLCLLCIITCVQLVFIFVLA